MSGRDEVLGADNSYRKDIPVDEIIALEQAVVEAAVAWHEDHHRIFTNTFPPGHKEIQKYDADGKLKTAVDALIAARERGVIK